MKAHTAVLKTNDNPDKRNAEQVEAPDRWIFISLTLIHSWYTIRTCLIVDKFLGGSKKPWNKKKMLS